MTDVKRSVGIQGVAAVLALLPTYAFAQTPTPVPSVAQSLDANSSHSPTSVSTSFAAKRAARDAARATYRAAVTAAQNGRDLAFADANATMMQSISMAGKDKAARNAARDVYKTAANGIISAYKQAIASAQADYRTALATINGK